MESDKLNMDAYKRQYYKSWASYRIPMQPVEPIDYKATEALNSFYLAYHLEDGKVAIFVKYIIEKTDIGQRKLFRKGTPMSKVYFESINFESETIQGKEIIYPATENHSVYYIGYVDTSGFKIQLYKIERKIFFCDDYTYWTNGNLKERVMTKQDGSISKFQYDKNGKKLQ